MSSGYCKEQTALVALAEGELCRPGSSKLVAGTRIIASGVWPYLRRSAVKCFLQFGHC